MKNATSHREAKGPWGYPLLGYLPDFLLGKLDFLSRCATQYGDVVKLNIGGPTFLLNNPEDIKHVLIMNPDNYDKSPRLTSPRGKRLSGEGLLTSVGSSHLRQRRRMQPAFYRTSIQAFAGTIINGVEERVAHWKSGTELNIAHENDGTCTTQHDQNRIRSGVWGPEWRAFERHYHPETVYGACVLLTISRMDA